MKIVSLTVIIDLRTEQKWANEYFNSEEEALQFCKDNTIIPKEIKYEYN